MKITGTAQHHVEAGPDYIIKLNIELSLRDLFAAFALAGMVQVFDTLKYTSADIVAGHAYEYADAMLRARDGEKV